MCRKPRLIKNPYLGLGGKGINYLHDTTHEFIEVPCGFCDQCIAYRQSSFMQRIQMESLTSYLFFFTLTYNNASLPYVSVGEYTLPVPDYRDIQLCFKRLNKDYNYNLQWLICSEYGSQNHRPHYHGILAIPKTYISEHISVIENQLVDRLKYQWCTILSTGERKPNCDYIWTPKGHTFDCHYIKPIPSHDSDVSYYVTKYCLKYDPYVSKLVSKICLDSSLSPEETSYLLGKVRPKVNISKGLGYWKNPEVRTYILSCLDKCSENPTFYDVNTGKPMAMARYYKKHLMPVSYRHNQYINSQFHNELTYISDEKSDIDDSILREKKGRDRLKKIQKIVQDSCI